MDSIQQKIDNLRRYLNEHNYNYYVLSKPTISDLEFDKKMKELEKLESEYPQYYDEHSPTLRVGSDINKTFIQEAHKYPMLSLSNSYSKEEVEEFYNRVSRLLNADFEIVCELKFDGTSISLTYINGKLNKAITRGDGAIGDNVTANVKTIKSIPLTLMGNNIPEEFEIRGEILMPWKVFDELNAKKASDNEPLFANPRNAASGTLKLQDPRTVADRKLDAYFYYMMGDNLPFSQHYDNLEQAKTWGFKIDSNIKKCKNQNEVFEFLEYWDKERHNLPVTTDGVVLKVNSLVQQNMLGYTSKFPRWAIAYKFQTEQAFSRLLSVSYQVGRTGAITPVANLEPVALSGSTVQRASLYNEDYIKSIDLHINDICIIEKGGEIIPKIVAVDIDKRSANSVPINFIDKCPECSSELIKLEGESIYYCPNEKTCPPQIKGKIEHFMTRKAMNIAGGGPETVEAIYNAGLINNIAGLYNLHIGQLEALDRWGVKKAENFLKGIEESAQIPFEKVLYALGIRFVGETVAKKLAFEFGTIDNLISASLEQLLSVEEIGIRIAQSIIDFFKQPENLQVIDELKKNGVQMSIAEDSVVTKSNKLDGASFVISGTFEKHSRDEYKKMIEENGGKNVSSISAKTDFFFTGNNIGPAKLEKAKKIGIKFINEDYFLKMLD